MASSIEVKPGVDWAGVFDPDLRVFDIIMRTNFGTSYNAYLVRGSGKTALIDLVKAPFADEFLDSLSKEVPLDKIDYIVANHTEPDHSGALAALLKGGYEPTVIASRSGLNFLKQIVNRPFKSEQADKIQTLDLGGKTLRFISAPFLHWPDSMITWLPEDKLIFSCDFLGSHFCDPRMFDDRIDDFSDNRKYYFQHIMRPFKKHVLAALDKLAALEIDTVCPSHGPVLRTGIQRYFDEYREWSTPHPAAGKKVIIAYVSAYGNTRLMAETIARGFSDKSVEVKLYDVT
ncbi:MAG: FprA family A-type flavoprotein, partial [bacterium]